MRTLRYFLCTIFLLIVASAEAGNVQFYHNTPAGVIRGEEVDIEVMLSGMTNEIYDLHLFYREMGEADYSSVLMRREGLLYKSTIKTADFTAAQMQYYIAYEGALGEIGTFPEEMAEFNPFIMEIAPARVLQEDGPVEVVILSPLEEETVVDEDIVVAVYVFSEEEQIDYANTRLVIDGVNIRTNIDFSDGASMVKWTTFKIVDKAMRFARRKSPWILHLDTGGCNGCAIEMFAMPSPRYDIERFGALSVGNPRHTDILLISGAISKKMEPRLKRIYEQIPDPKAVVAVGACAITKGVFHDAYNIAGPLDKVLPVDVYVPGCPPKPEAMIQALLEAVDIWHRRYIV